MNKVDEQPNNVAIVAVLILLAGWGNSLNRNTSSLRVLLAQHLLCGAAKRQPVGYTLGITICNDTTGEYVVIMQLGICTTVAEHSGKMECGTGIKCVAGIEW